MQQLYNSVKGPFKDEAAFKVAVLKKWRKDMPWYTRFEIENEEKEPGMPDVLSMHPTGPSFFTEFKITDAKGIATFRRTQLNFYGRHGGLTIDVLVWDTRFNRVVLVTSAEVLAAKSLKVRIPEDL